ncbi:ComF family protein [Gryllotalpicola protaetiae]|uniref:ComF family protein n=1 Tax=Gryllotalpicola protaetiae TaxID=2419771 RepID=A0A387BJM9_9MICO|nr:phosphoribosyltransferase family protein [Gryllotalpicola protaetiae]AYG04305.1 ComF family protein [Gryllotalpicola protaetiae]
MWAGVREAVLDAWAVLAPTECAGCGEPDRALCSACRAELAAAPVVHETLRRDDGSELPVWHALDYGGAPRSILLAFKDGGRTDAAPALAGVLRRVVRAALVEAPIALHGRVEVAAIPSSRSAFRRRGYRHVPLLLRHAGFSDSRLLRTVRQTQDQSNLDTTSRFANRAQSLTVKSAAAGRAVLIIDDIVTTGATVLEADRAFRAVGCVVLGAVALARTERRLPKLGADVEMRRKAS